MLIHYERDFSFSYSTVNEKDLTDCEHKGLRAAVMSHLNVILKVNF